MSPTDPKALEKPKTSEEIKALLNLRTAYDPKDTLRQAELAIRNGVDEDEDGQYELSSEWVSKNDPVFRALTLSEFKNGSLMVNCVPDEYRTFVINMSCKIQEDYNCLLASEKSLAELAAINFVRTLEIQRKITNYLDMKSLTDNGVKYLAILSKELDRANRHFIAVIQTLRMLKQSPVSVNVKAQTAFVGQNQ